jgi:hypothetical protein
MSRPSPSLPLPPLPLPLPPRLLHSSELLPPPLRLRALPLGGHSGCASSAGFGLEAPLLLAPLLPQPPGCALGRVQRRSFSNPAPGRISSDRHE